MLQSMRDGAGKWLVWVVIIIVIIALSLWGISSYFLGGNASTPPVAKVNGEKISQDELSSAYNRLRQSQPKLFTAPGSSSKIKTELLQQLISKSVLAQAAVEEGFAIGQDELNSFLTQIPAFQSDGQFSQAQFSMVLNRMMYTPAQFMNDMRKTLLINQVRNGIGASTFALPKETSSFIKLLEQKRDIGFLIIPASRFIKQVKINEQQLKTYYQANQNDFKIPEKVSISYLEIAPKNVEASIKPTMSELMSYYEDNLTAYTTPARWHVAHILLHIPKNSSSKQINELTEKLAKFRKQVVNGTAFAKLAKQNSQDVMTANQGGQMPWFTAGSLGPVFEKTVADLKPGEISEPVQTRYGMELIKLIALDKQKVKSYKDVSSQVLQTYKNQQMQKIIADKNDELANVTFENPNTLTIAAKQLKLTIHTTPLFTRAGTKSGLTAKPNVLATAFSEDVLQQGNNSDIITLKDGALVVLRVNKHIPASVKPLASVRNIVKKKLVQQQAEKEAMNLGEKLLPQIKTSAQATRFSSKHGLRWITKLNISRMTKDVNVQILQQAFNMKAPLASDKLNVAGLKLSDGDYALVGVTQLNIPKVVKITQKQHLALIQQVENTYGQSSYNAYVKTQQDKAKIKHYSDNL